MASRWRQGVRWLFRRNRVNADIDRELAFHVSKETEARIAAGMPPAEARRTTLRDFGGVDSTAEAVRDVRGVTFWDSLTQDIRFGWRTLRRSPGYTVAAVLTLALGIGANAAMFSVIDGVLIKPLPFREGNRLVLVRQSAPASKLPDVGVSIAELFEYRQRLQTIEDLVEHHSMSFILLNHGEPDRVDTGVVSANFFEMIGIKPVYGRTFVPKDDELGADAVLVLSYEYWQKKFGGDPTVIGRVLQMNDRPHTVVGVLPAFPQYPRNEDVYMSTSACPFRSAAQKTIAQNFRAFNGLSVFGRLAPGRTVEEASAELATVAASFEQAHAKDYHDRQLRGLTSQARGLEDTLVVGAKPMLTSLAATTLLVLLIACANVASLSIARTSRRSREFAVRTALGAGRRRLLRQLVTESVLVAAAGGTAGLGLAWLSLDLLVSFVGRFTARTGQIDLNPGVLLFTAGVSILTGIVAGLAPALSAGRNQAQSMRDGAPQAGETASRHRIRSTLVVAQVAVAFVLLTGAALMLQSFHRLSSVSLGYDTDRFMTARTAGAFNVPPPKLTQANLDILDRLRAAPGVEAAAMTSAVPLTRVSPNPPPVELEGRPLGDRQMDANLNVSSDGYFSTLQIPMLLGRDFRLSDTADAPKVAIINASMAKFWDGESPVGRRFRRIGSGDAGWATVIGVASDFYLDGGDRGILAEFYVPLQQFNGFGGGRLIVRSAGQPGTLVQAMKDAVHSVNPNDAIQDFKTLSELKDGRLAAPRLTMTLLVTFAILALVITLTGIAGIIATTVSQRTREFGLRMALGGTRSSVLSMVVGQAMRLVTLGVVLGAGGAVLFSRSLQQFLFQTAPTEWTAYVVTAAVFLAAGAIACAAPARRATTIEPLTALRTD